MKHKIFVTQALPEHGLDALLPYCEIEVYTAKHLLDRGSFLEKIQDKEGVIGLLTDRIDEEFFAVASQLRAYANYAVGYDNIDLKAATRHKIPVSNTPGVLTEATAELAWGLLFAVARKIVEADRVMRSGAWEGWGPLQFLGTGVSGKTLGIVGSGRIGTAMARMSRGFGMRVLYCSQSGRQNAALDTELQAQCVSFETLIAEADYISLHAPLTSQSRHMFSKPVFERMKSSAILINTGRGPLINEQDLVQALQSGQIGGAGLDVYELEPRMAKGLADLPNTVLLPHIGSATVQTRTKMAEIAAQNLLAALEGKKPEHCLNPELFGESS